MQEDRRRAGPRDGAVEPLAPVCQSLGRAEMASRTPLPPQGHPGMPPLLSAAELTAATATVHTGQGATVPAAGLGLQVCRMPEP